MGEKSITIFKYKPNYLYLIIGIAWLLLAISRSTTPIPKYSIYTIIVSYVVTFLPFLSHYKQLKYPYLILNEESITIRINHLGWTHKVLWVNVLKVYGNEKRVFLEEKKNEKIRTHYIYLCEFSKADAEQLLPLIQTYKGE